MDDSPIQTALCVIGHPIGGNPTQFVALRALAALGLDWQFVSFDVEPSQIEKAVGGIDSLGFCGAMIASPYQTKVASILADSGGQANKIDAAADEQWHDCLSRGEKNGWLASNLYAEAFRGHVESHAAKTGHPFEGCLLIDEPQKLDDLTLPLKSVLPAEQFFVVGATFKRWPENLRAATPETTHEPDSPIEPPPAVAAPSLATSPWLVVWGLDSKPKKKLLSKGTSASLSPAFLSESLSQLHPDSLIVDLSGTASSWLATRSDPTDRPISMIGSVDLELSRLVTAIKRWTGRDPNPEMMREAIEEYLEV